MRVKLFLSLVLCAASALVCAQKEDPQLRKEIQAYYLMIDRQAMKGDFTASLKALDPSYVLVDKDGKTTTYAEIKKLTEGLKGKVRNVKASTVVKFVQSQGAEAVAWIETKLSFQLRDGNDWISTSSTERAAESFKKTPTGWKCYYSQGLPTNEPWNFGG